MKVSLILFTARHPHHAEGVALQEALEYARVAEENGWHEVWTTEHFFNPLRESSCALTMAAFLLGMTKRVTVGTAVVVMAHTSPVALAARSNLLEQLARGRFRLGVGRGQVSPSRELYGREGDWSESFVGELSTLLAARDNSPLSYQGSEMFAPVHVVPGRKGATPTAIAVRSEVSVRLAAQHGLAMILDGSDSENAKMLEVYDSVSVATPHALPRSEHLVRKRVHFASSREEAEHELAKSVTPWGQAYTRCRAFRSPDEVLQDEDPDDFSDDALGTPEDIAAHFVVARERTGCEQFLIDVDALGDRERAVTNIRRFSQEVMPLLGV